MNKGFGLLGIIIALIAVGGFYFTNQSGDKAAKSPLEIGIDAKKQADEVNEQFIYSDDELARQIKAGEQNADTMSGINWNNSWEDLNDSETNINEPVEWIQARPPNSAYSITVSHPAGWLFLCCGDKDTTSNHVIYSSGNTDDDSQRILITEHSLIDSEQGNLEDLISIGEEDKIVQVEEALSNDFARVGNLTLKAMATTASVFMNNENGVRTYIFGSGQRVIEVQFVGFSGDDTNFADEFMSRIKPFVGRG